MYTLMTYYNLLVEHYNHAIANIIYLALNIILLDIVSNICTSPVMMRLELYLTVYGRVRVILRNSSLLVNM
jgi:hypothetical protein